MYGNSLVEYYKTEAAKRGVLDLRKTEFRQRWGKGVEQYLEFISTPSGRYYVKETDKMGVDSEVLLSQIYARAGLKTTIYTPAKDNFGKTVVLSNDIKTPSNTYAYDFFRTLRKDFPGQPMVEGFPSYKSSFPGANLTKFMRASGIRDYLTMTALDVGCYNDDRHLSNFIFETGPLGRVKALSVFDYGQSGENFRDAREAGSTLSEEHLLYPNLFNCGHKLSRACMINQFKNNESTLPYMKPTELAETVGSIDPVAISKDIKGEIGYKISQKYVDTIASSLDNLAEDLVK